MMTQTSPARPVRFRLSRIAACMGAAMVGLAVPALGSGSVRVAGYDFGYLTSGDANARPIQVFDDGGNTFFQFRAGAAVPAIFSVRTGVPQLVYPEQEGPYIKVPELHGRFVLQVGRAQAQVVHGGGTRSDAPPVSVATASGRGPYVQGAAYPADAQLVASLSPVAMGGPQLVDDALERNSYATPRRGDAVTWQSTEARREESEVWFARGTPNLTAEGRRVLLVAAKSLPSDARVTVVGRDDDSYKEGLDEARAQAMRDMLVKAGVPAARVVTRVGVAGKQRGKHWSSTLVVEQGGMPAAPAQRGGSALANLQALVRAGVLRLEQAEAIARSHQLGSLHAAAPAGQGAFGVAGANAAGSARPWEMRKADGSVDKMLSRWGSEAGWTVVWKDGPPVPITGDAQLPPSDFLAAADYVVRKAQEVGYRISATAYSNQTLVVGAAK